MSSQTSDQKTTYQTPRRAELWAQLWTKLLAEPKDKQVAAPPEKRGAA